MATTKKYNFLTKSTPDDPTKIPTNIDVATTFFVSIIPEEVKLLIPILHSLPNKDYRIILTKVIEYMITNTFTDTDFIQFQKSVTTNNTNADIGLIFTAIYTILRVAIAGKVSITTLNTDMKRLNYPIAAADDLCKALLSSRNKIEKSILNSRISFPRLQKLRWRVDVAISTGSLSRVMRPCIVMQLILDNKNIKTFEVSIDQFNQLRHSVAKILLDMQTIERHPIMKLVTEISIRDEIERNK